jgi:sugar phosphate isomerase/epimerase
MDRLLITTDYDNLSGSLDLATREPIGLELQLFSDPLILSERFEQTLAEVRQQLAGFRIPIGVHGAFMDMSPGSPDPAVAALTRERYRQGLQAAAALGAGYMVVHLNYLGLFKLDNYRQGWHQRQLAFWAAFAQEAAEAGVPILLENSWEDEPALITAILDEVGHPFLRACLDVAHATLYGKLPIEAWIKAFEPYLHCCHLNNHDGQTDLHWPLGEGIVDYDEVLASLRGLAEPPLLVLELNNLNHVRQSLKFFRLNPSSPG